jgi:hypothetical protein
VPAAAAATATTTTVGWPATRRSAVRPQQYLRQPSELGATGALTTVFIEQPSQLSGTNAQDDVEGDHRQVARSVASPDISCHEMALELARHPQLVFSWTDDRKMNVAVISLLHNVFRVPIILLRQVKYLASAVRNCLQIPPERGGVALLRSLQVTAARFPEADVPRLAPGMKRVGDQQK